MNMHPLPPAPTRVGHTRASPLHAHNPPLLHDHFGNNSPRSTSLLLAPSIHSFLLEQRIPSTPKSNSGRKSKSQMILHKSPVSPKPFTRPWSVFRPRSCNLSATESAVLEFRCACAFSVSGRSSLHHLPSGRLLLLVIGNSWHGAITDVPQTTRNFPSSCQQR
ncbi:hypothetical protein K458DRAFT_412496 [Lentithecium fluviatile CBS 122367]|uniref:Uncharacterized protein n=1 Tax=Lentithecium fluviatile CBS 122367 TaxID=1168545 RepID=A0A6G1JL24_9PLEO|nr:hypothetical protein K458DRAFT_412496 [Lentithecium fluviatile CBS 122367]